MSLTMVAPKKPFLPKEPFSLKCLNIDLINDKTTIGLIKINRNFIIPKNKICRK